MESTITYRRHGSVSFMNIQSRLVPNPIAVKFVVIEHELGHSENAVKAKDHVMLDELLIAMGIEILDVSPTADSDVPRPYTHRKKT